MLMGILDEYDKSIMVPYSLSIEDAINLLDKMEKYIPAFFAKNSQGSRIIELYSFEKNNNSLLVTIPICDCEWAIRQYRDYSAGMYELITSPDSKSYDPGEVYDKDVIFVNNCFNDPECNYEANVGQALNQFECLLSALPDIRNMKKMLIGLINGKIQSPYTSIFCHSVCTFYKRLIKEI